MKYDTLAHKISVSSGLSLETVKTVLFAVPDGLVTLKEGEKVRTPLGVFRMTRRAARKVTAPGKKGAIDVGEEMVVKLRAGTRLRKAP